MIRILLIVFTVLIFGCEKEIFSLTPQQTVKKGGHFSTPRIVNPRIAPDSVGWLIEFTPSCRYIIKDGDKISDDQQDWNKTCGLYFHPYDTHSNTAMLGFRYNVEKDLIELNFYNHISHAVSYTGTLYSTPIGEQIEYRIVPKYSTGDVVETIWKDKKLISCIVFDFPEIKGRKSILSNEINFYFGGNRQAPQDITVKKQRINY